jgi:predicted nucleotidyltransferase component of viral defense system
MLELKEISKYYKNPENLNPRHILREYLQFKILSFLFESEISSRISFLGGTCIRIVHGNDRFSEYLDFDNFNLSFEEFIKTSEFVKKSLENEGFEVEIKNVKKGAYHCDIRFPELLYKNDLTPLKTEKILIQIDTISHKFEYKPDIFLLNKFGILKKIFVTPQDILLSQKIHAAFQRKRLKGRDFYDISFLLGFTKPNYDYLKKVLDIKKQKELKEYILENSKNIDFKKLAKDIEPFLIKQETAQRVILFKELITQVL